MHRHKQTPFWLFVFFLLSGCQSGISDLYSEGFPSTASWRILPFINLSAAAGVGPRVERMVAVLLPSVGIKYAELYQDQGASPIEITGEPAEVGTDILIGHGIGYSVSAGFAIGGKIEDWFIDGDGHAHVSLGLYVNDVGSGATLWDVSGSHQGMAGESIYDVSRSLITALLKQLPVNRGYRF
ncbi:MAG: hypothetical protein PUP46_10015 [Endozoicomonas sp. (ex Botrylloides leachii)]|nr:hypothetical protein [Endozoicomonas sp. (ex Botrylloides leachii)]